MTSEPKRRNFWRRNKERIIRGTMVQINILGWFSAWHYWDKDPLAFGLSVVLIMITSAIIEMNY